MAVYTDYSEDRDRYVKESPTLFQQLDWIPVVSNVSGAVRGVFGIIEMAVGIITLIPEIIYTVITGNPHIYLIADGALNLLRGMVAEVFFIGNVVLYLHDTRRL